MQWLQNGHHKIFFYAQWSDREFVWYRLQYYNFDPLSPNSDQQPFSGNDIPTLSWDEAMSIN